MAQLLCLVLLLLICDVTRGKRSPSPTPSFRVTPTPYPSSGGARCTGTQSYRIRATYNWNPPDYDQQEPGLGFTPLLCAGHSTKFRFWNVDSMLSSELQVVIKSLNLTLIEQSLFDHVRANNRTVASYNRSIINPIMKSPDGRDEVYNVTLNGDMNATLISCFAAFVPSPDWFTGFSSYDMCERNSSTGLFSWRGLDDKFGIIPYDAGIDSSERIQFEGIPEDPQQLVRVKLEYLSELGDFRISNMNVTYRKMRVEEKKRKQIQHRECFPENVMVTLHDGSKIRIDQVVIGDMLGNVPGKNSSPVFMFSHRNHDVHSWFVRLHFGIAQTLTASSGHLVFVNGELKEMDEIRIGDSLHSDDGKMLKVLRVEQVWQRGLYNPHTLSGELVVNGVKVSAYTRAVKPAVARSMLSVVRALHSCVFSRGLSEAVSKLFDDNRLRSRIEGIVSF